MRGEEEEEEEEVVVDEERLVGRDIKLSATEHCFKSVKEIERARWGRRRRRRKTNRRFEKQLIDQKTRERVIKKIF